MLRTGQNLTIHWHGIHQRGTPFQDGPNQVTQCPIKAGRNQVYKFPLHQHGTYWYHSHVGSQYTEGIRGALIIYPKEEYYHYDSEMVVTLGEWYHSSYMQNEEWYLSPASGGSPPYPDSILMNNLGQYNCTFAIRKGLNCSSSNQFRPVFTLQEGNVHKLRLINMGGWATFEVEVDSHKLLAVEVDGIDVQTTDPVDVAYIGAGQRYAFILQRANISDNRKEFTIRATLKTEYLFLNRSIPNINPFPEALRGIITGVIRYTNQNVEDFHVLPVPEPFSYFVKDEKPSDAEPRVYLNDSHLRPLGGEKAPDCVNFEDTLTITFGHDHKGIRRGSFNKSPFQIPTGKPLLLRAIKGENFTTPYPYIKTKLGDVVQLVFNNPMLGAHPIHMHGHHFWVVSAGGVGAGDFTPTMHNLTLDGAMRDTAMVKERSHLVIRFRADNPGVWAIHCHIDWHAQSGMLAVVEEAIELARQLFEVPESAKQVCADHGVIV